VFLSRRRIFSRVPPMNHRLKSVLPPPWRYQAHCPSPSGLTAQGYSLLAQSGVRTFLPPSQPCAFQASDRPAHPPSPLYRESLLRELRCCANDAFEAEHDTAGYERKISLLMARAYRRIKRENPENCGYGTTRSAFSTEATITSSYSGGRTRL
jgi:hypothetical protein